MPEQEIRWVSATRIEVLTPVVAASVWHVHAEGWYWCLGDTVATAVKSGGPMKRDDAVMAAIDAVETQAHPMPLYSTRAAMRDAGLPDWEPGSGMSSADAIRELARQRDEARDNARIERENCRALETKLAEVCTTVVEAVVDDLRRCDENSVDAAVYNALQELLHPEDDTPREVLLARLAAAMLTELGDAWAAKAAKDDD